MWSFFNWAQKEYNLKDNPVYNIEIPRKTTDYSARPFLQHDIKRLLDLIKRGDR